MTELKLFPRSRVLIIPISRFISSQVLLQESNVLHDEMKKQTKGHNISKSVAIPTPVTINTHSIELEVSMKLA